LSLFQFVEVIHNECQRIIYETNLRKTYLKKLHLRMLSAKLSVKDCYPLATARGVAEPESTLHATETGVKIHIFFQ
jgi:hypothetical protein